MAEIWIVAAASLVLLGTGISWIVSVAYPDKQAVTAAPLAEPPVDASSGGPPPAAVIILQDKSPGPDTKPAAP